MKSQFDVNKFLGKWHVLLHYLTPEETNRSYNTTVTVMLLNGEKDDSKRKIDVVTTTYENGFSLSTYALGTPLGNNKYHTEIYNPAPKKMRGAPGLDTPNFIIARVFRDRNENYKFVVVTSEKKDFLWVLSREPNPSLEDYEDVLAFVTPNFDEDKFILTPHYAS